MDVTKNTTDFFDIEISKAQAHLDGLVKAREAYFSVNTQTMASVGAEDTRDPNLVNPVKIEMSTYVDKIIDGFPTGKEFGIGDIYKQFQMETNSLAQDEERDRAKISSVLSRRKEKGTTINKLHRGLFKKVDPAHSDPGNQEETI